LFVAVLGILVTRCELFAWSGAGHMVIAAEAWRELSPAQKAKASRRKLGSREDLNLFSGYVSFRDRVFHSETPSDSSCPQNLIDEDFCARIQFFCHHLSSN